MKKRNGQAKKNQPKRKSKKKKITKRMSKKKKKKVPLSRKQAGNRGSIHRWTEEVKVK